jgi:hypothetical protein
MVNPAAALGSGPPVVDLRPAAARPARPEAETSLALKMQPPPGYTLKAPDGSPGFLVQQLLAGAPEPGPDAPSRSTSLAAYQAQILHRISYSGPLTPIDLTV